MAFLRRVLGGGKKEEVAPSATTQAGPRVSGNRYWRCPTCGGVQGKKELDSTYKAGAALDTTATASCAKCGAEHPATEVYGGAHDFTGEVELLSRVQIARKYLEAEMAQDANALEALLAPDAVHASMRGETAGAKAIADRLRNPGPMGGMMGRLQWDAPAEEGDTVKIDGRPTMPNAPFPGLTMTLSFDAANKIKRIEMGRKA